MTVNSDAQAVNAAPVGADVGSSGARLRRLVLVATIGNTLDWYDFLIYGFLAGTIAKLFFPTESELASLLLSVATFGVGAVVRPIGALVLGIYSDRVGRKAALTLTIFLMALGTGLIAVAPTYASIGIWAPLLIVISRLLQGFSCGGELGGATAILVENAPDDRRGLYGSWQTASQAAGLMLGTMMTTLVSLSMTPAQFEAGGWRWLFAIGLLIVPVGFYVRSKLDEPEVFLKARKEAAVFSFTETVRDQYRPLLTGTGVGVLYAACAYVLFIYMPTFAVRQLVLPFSQALIATTVAGCVVFVGSPRPGCDLRSIRPKAAPPRRRTGLRAVNLSGFRCDQCPAESRQTRCRAVGVRAGDGGVRRARHLGICGAISNPPALHRGVVGAQHPGRRGRRICTPHRYLADRRYRQCARPSLLCGCGCNRQHDRRAQPRRPLS